MNKTIGFITNEKVRNLPENTVGSSRIRCRWLWENWPEAEEWQIGKPGYKVLILQKAYVVTMLTLMDMFKGITIFDNCDADFLDNKMNVFEYYSKADAVTTSSQALADYIQKLLPNKPVVFIPDRIDLKTVQNYKKEHAKNLKKIVWFGYSNNFMYVEPALGHISEMGMSLDVYSDVEIQAPDNVKEFTWHKYDYNRMNQELIQYDAALFPLERDKIDERGKYKSNNKTILCQALGLPVIQLPTDLTELQDQKTRQQVGEKLRLEAWRDYDVRLSVKQYQDLIKQL